MPLLLSANAHRALLVLVLATGAAFWMRSDGLTGVCVGAGTLLIAYLKGRLVVLDFMELRHAPLLWRGLIEGWLFVVAALLLSMYVLRTLHG